MAAYSPEAGDIVWLDFGPTAGHEQQGRRPALVLSEYTYNTMTGLCVVCPITSTARGWPFHVEVPTGLKVDGVIMADQPRTLAWAERGCRLAATAPADVLRDVRERLATLLGID